MKKNHSGDKYIVAAEMGQCIDNCMGRYHKPSGQWQFFLRSHILSDGIAAWTDLMKLNDIRMPQRPQTKHQAIPSLYSRLILLFRHIRRLKNRHYPWVHYDKSKKGAGAGFGYLMFSKEDTDALIHYCKSSNVSLNGLLLQTLDKLTSDVLMTQPCERTWLIPVNVRDLITTHQGGNYTASIALRLSSAPTVKEIHDQLTELYQSGIHWGAWIYSNITGLIGLTGLRFFAKRTSYTPFFGVFSNIGNWNLPAGDGYASDDYRFIAWGPVTTFGPVSAGLISWRGQLGVSLQLHPALTDHIQDTEQTLRAWVRDIKNALSPDHGSNFNDVEIGVIPRDDFYANAIRF